jgi:hypothetical protein
MNFLIIIILHLGLGSKQLTATTTVFDEFADIAILESHVSERASGGGRFFSRVDEDQHLRRQESTEYQ